jgi:hypothetical protein
MRSAIPARHRLAATIVVGALVAAVAIPVLAADPSEPPSPGPAAASTAPDASPKAARSPKPDKPNRADKAAKAAKPPAVDVTVRGTVARRTAADGSDEYVVQSGGETLVLDAGPAWFHGDQHPLAAHVGRTVTIAGERREGSTELEVRTIDGTAIREPGKPPWAGGWKQVGERHPGWTQEKWDRWQAKRAEQARRHGLECWPPGHCKDGSAKDVTPAS